MLSQINNIFLVGIKGVGMANLALILKKMGKNVLGSDIEEEFITDKQLIKEKIVVTAGFSPSHIPQNTQVVVYSAAHGGRENVQVLEAKRRGIKVYHQAAFIAELMKQFRTTIAVTGSHGKTTTASLLAYALIKLGAKPTYLVGSSDFNGYSAGDYGSNDYFVVEADEYGVDPPKDKTPKFKFFYPDIIVVTNIDFDHPDVYKDLNDIEKAFEEFFTQGKKVIKGDELKVFDVITNEKGTSFKYMDKTFQISIYGEKNALNAAAVIQTLSDLGFELNKVHEAIKDFKGAARRFEQKFVHADTYLFDDYAHHPAEIEATIKATRQRFPKKRIIVAFQPHTYSRTQSLLSEFSTALSQADYTFILPIFASAREDVKKFTVTSEDVAKNAKKGNIEAVGAKEILLKKLKERIKKGDVVFTMGAGDVYKLENDIISLIRKL